MFAVAWLPDARGSPGSKGCEDVKLYSFNGDLTPATSDGRTSVALECEGQALAVDILRGEIRTMVKKYFAGILGSLQVRKVRTMRSASCVPGDLL